MKLSPLSRVLSAGGAAALVVLTVHPAAMAREVTASAVRSSDVMSQHAEVPGATLWTKRFNGSGNGDDGAGALRVSPDGTKVFVAGGSRVIGGGFEGLTIAYDATSGATLWIGRYGEVGAAAMGVSPDGTKVFVTGAGPGGYNTVALDASTGTVLWVARYSGPVGGPDFPTALAVSPDGTRVFVTGVSRGFLSICGVNQAGQVGMGPLDTHPCFDFATVAYEASGGEMLWVTRSKARTGGGDDGATALSVSPDGSKVFVTGTSSPPPEDVSDYATYAYAASTGATLWMRVYADPADSPAFPAAIQASPDGTKVFVTGTSGDSFGTIAYDASTGAVIWLKRFRNPAGSYDDAVALALSSDGSRLFITGVEWFSENRYATVAYDASTGKLVWVNYFVATAGFGEPTAVGVTRDGSTVVVTGTGGTTPTSDSDYWTVALTASTGAQLWASRYDGPAHDYDHASALGLSPDGTKAFVTGWSTGIGTGFDSATIAYSLT